jgi:uncharacterized protein
MISEKMKRFIEEVNHAFVASADQRARPHLAAAHGLAVPDPHHIVFEAWFCHKTLENVAEVPRLAIAILDPASGTGYQLSGRVESTANVGILNGFAPELEEPGMPQVETRMVVRVEEILEFSQGPHTDHPIAAES